MSYNIFYIAEPVLLRTIFTQGGIDYMKLGDNLLEYNTNFRLYIMTRLRNPHYLPEIAVKVGLSEFCRPIPRTNQKLKNAINSYISCTRLHFLIS